MQRRCWVELQSKREALKLSPVLGMEVKVVVIGTKLGHVPECIVDVVDNRCCDCLFPTVGDDCDVAAELCKLVSIQVAINAADECTACHKSAEDVAGHVVSDTTFDTS